MINPLKKKQSKENFIQKATLGLLDLVLPDGIYEGPDYVYLGPKKYARTYALSALPNSLSVGIYNEFFEVGTIDVSSYVQNTENGNIIDTLTNKISVLASNMISEKNKGNMIDYGTQKAVADLDSLREAIQTNTDRMYYVQSLVVVWGTSKVDLEDRCESFESKCRGKTIQARCLMKDQAKAFITALPYGNVKIKENLRNMTMGGSACLVPTGNTELSHPHGDFWGENVFTKSLVFYDPFIAHRDNTADIINPHILLIGTTGSGKSYTKRLLICRGAAAGKWIIDLDPENEDQHMIEHKLNGQYRVIRPGEKTGINPLELDVSMDNGVKFIDIYGKCSDITNMLAMFSERFRQKPLEANDLIAIEESVKKLYSDREITSDAESLYEDVNEVINGEYFTGKRKKRLPILTDLRNELAKNEYVKGLADSMKLITGDMSLGIFDCETSIDLKNRVIGFGLKYITDPFMRFFSMVNILSWSWAKFSDWQFADIEKEVIFDEGHQFTKCKDSAPYIEEISRRGRKYKIALVIASQKIDEFINTAAGQVIIDQCATRLLLRQDPMPAKRVCDYFDLPDRCKGLLEGFPSGYGILMAGNTNVVVHMMPFDDEWEYIKKYEGGAA